MIPEGHEFSLFWYFLGQEVSARTPVPASCVGIELLLEKRLPLRVVQIVGGLVVEHQIEFDKIFVSIPFREGNLVLVLS